MTIATAKVDWNCFERVQCHVYFGNTEYKNLQQLEALFLEPLLVVYTTYLSQAPLTDGMRCLDSIVCRRLDSLLIFSPLSAKKRQLNIHYLAQADDVLCIVTWLRTAWNVCETRVKLKVHTTQRSFAEKS